MPANKTIDFKKASKLLGGSKLELATEHAGVSGVHRGGDEFFAAGVDAADDDRVGIEDVDQQRQALAEARADCFPNREREGVEPTM